MNGLCLKIFVFFVVAFLGACQNNVRPEIVPAVVKPVTSHQLGVIGEVEPVYFLPMKSPFPSRIDTGAETSSIDAKNVKSFERDGEKWVAFTVINRDTNESYRFEKPLKRKVSIRRSGKNEDRKVVIMDIRIGGQNVKEEFTLANRNDFDYQGLIGRNVLTGRAIVDTSLSNTLH